MLFTSPPSELVSYVQEKLSFSGQDGLTLSELWIEVAKFLDVKSDIKEEHDFPTVDTFQQQCIWQWLFFSQEIGDVLPLYAEKDGLSLVIHPNYTEFIKLVGPENEIRIKPTADTQWTHLTGLEPLKKLRTQIGDKPFELLVVIAKHGAKGILSPELVREAGQDARSMPSRFKKLEEMGLIVKTSVYVGASHQHTNHLVHIKFSQTSPILSEITVSRRSVGLRHVIIDAVRTAPNQLRGFLDLKTELKMNGKKLGGKLFGEIIDTLHKLGNIEKLTVRDTKTDASLYAIKYIKDLPKNLSHLADYVQTFTSTSEDFVDQEELSNVNEQEDDVVAVPNVNQFFPIQNQLYQAIQTNTKTGITSKELVRSLSGVSGFRPWVRLLDTLASYVVDDKILVPLRHHPDHYDDISIVRSYDFEGKFKIYRYFTKDTYTIPNKAHAQEIQVQGKVQNLPLAELTRKLYTPLGNVALGPFIKLSGKTAQKITKKQKTGKETTLATASETPAKQTRKARAKKLVVEEDEEEEEEDTFNPEIAYPDNEAYHPEQDLEAFQSQPEEYRPAPLQSIQPIIPSLPAPSRQSSKVKKIVGVADSLKGRKRREGLVDIVKSDGGVIYTHAKLRRRLDEKLGHTTTTDIKTLVRDISLLIDNGELVSETISFTKTGQLTTRRLLIVTNPRPSEEQIERVRRECITDVGDRPLPSEKRVVDGNVVLFVSKKKDIKKKRLDSSDVDPEKRKRKSRSAAFEPSTLQSVSSAADISDSPDISVFVAKKHRRKSQPKKRVDKKRSSGAERRVRTLFKFDKSDATTLFRAIVISKSLRRKIINYQEIAELFNDIDAKSIKQKWSVVRKLVGGLQAVTKGIEKFEQIVMTGIENGMVVAENLEKVSLEFFLDLWQELGSSDLEEVDKTPLFSTVEENLNEYIKIEVNEAGLGDLFEQLEDHSMKQKEEILSAVPFFLNDVPYEIKPKQHDDLRTVLKAIFSTSEENFSAVRVRQILSEYGDEVTHEATSALIKDREMIYYGSDDTDSKFMLTDKVINSVLLKMPNKLLHQATKFDQHLQSIVEASKALILSQNVANGDMALIFQLISSQNVSLVHIDKAYQFVGYESRLIDKEKLACDIVVVGEPNYTSELIKTTPVPIGKACSHIWLDLNGNINHVLWIQITNLVLYHVHFRPGIPQGFIYGKLQTILGVRDFHAVIDWLVASGCIVRGSHEGLWTTGKWYKILGLGPDV